MEVRGPGDSCSDLVSQGEVQTGVGIGSASAPDTVNLCWERGTGEEHGDSWESSAGLSVSVTLV